MITREERAKIISELNELSMKIMQLNCKLPKSSQLFLGLGLSGDKRCPAYQLVTRVNMVIEIEKLDFNSITVLKSRYMNPGKYIHNEVSNED